MHLHFDIFNQDDDDDEEMTKIGHDFLKYLGHEFEMTTHIVSLNTPIKKMHAYVIHKWGDINRARRQRAKTSFDAYKIHAYTNNIIPRIQSKKGFFGLFSSN